LTRGRRLFFALVLPLALAGLVLAVLIGLSASAARMQVAGGAPGGHLRPCPGPPNCVGSEDPDAAHRIAPLAFDGDPEAAWRDLLAFLARERGSEVVEEDGGYAHLLARTPWLRFTDDLELRLDRAAHVIHVRSSSRVGRSDLGANARRIEAIRARWRHGG
jgi:uncharacterized protein (DUF1499 family)